MVLELRQEMASATLANVGPTSNKGALSPNAHRQRVAPNNLLCNGDHMTSSAQSRYSPRSGLEPLVG